MEQEDTIIENLMKQLETVISNKKVKINKLKDYKEERGEKQVVVGITSVTNHNFGLMDYDFTLRILIDFFIKDDTEGYFFNETKKKVFDFIQKHYLLTRANYADLEQGIVCVVLEDKLDNKTESSQQCYIDLKLIGSWDPE